VKNVLYIQSAKDTVCSQLKFSGARHRLAASGVSLCKVFAEEYHASDLRDQLAFWNAKGLIVDCRGHRPPFAERLLPGVPVVYLDLAREFESRGRLSVSYDIRATCHLAARELLQLDCAAYGYAGYGRVPWSEERRRVFAKALQLNGRTLAVFSLDPSTVRPSDFYRPLSAWLSDLPKPCAVFAADDAYALHVLSTAQNLKLRIPGDVAILGVDDESSDLTTPGLSSIRLDFQAAGRLAAELILEKLTRPRLTVTNRYFGPVQLLRRGSTRKLRKAEEDFAVLLERIRERTPQGLTAAEVASWLPGSRRLAEIRFREATGHSILEEITAARIDHAKELLLSTNSTINEIADLCGYRTVNAFREAFTAVIGKTPRLWRTHPTQHA